MVALERSPGNAQAGDEIVQLGVRLVADEMTPSPPPMPPQRLVDQNHRASLAWPTREHAGMHELELRVAWERHVGADQTWLDVVLDRHREPHRQYHGVRHVGWVVRHVAELAEIHRARITDVGALVAAAFFHDAVYDPTRSDNEVVSGRLAERALTELGWPAERADRVAGLVRATADHAATSAPGDELDTAVLLAADLAVLGSDPANYAEYVTGVRAEYAHVSDDDWRRGRSAVLRGFVERPAIFDPALELTTWERRARANLAAELAELNSVSGE